MGDGTEGMQALVDGLCSLDHDSAVTVVTSVLQARPELAPSVVNFSVPDLTYPPSKALIERRSTGMIKSFSEEKGFGFIQCEELMGTFGHDVFLHRAQASGFGVGSQVSFAVMLNKENKPQGYDLMLATNKGGGPAKGAKGAAKGGAKGGGDWGGGGGGGWAEEGSWGWQPQWTGGGKGGGQAGGGGGALGPGCASHTKGCQGKGGKSGDEGGKRKGRPKVDYGAELEQLGHHVGVIKSYTEKTGYGFIECPELKNQFGNDVFLHSKDYEGFQIGDQIEFNAFLNGNGKPQAKDLQSSGGGKRQKTEGEEYVGYTPEEYAAMYG